MLIPLLYNFNNYVNITSITKRLCYRLRRHCMTLRHLKIFIQVCTHNSFSKAAEELDMSQPAVSAAIKELEQYYDVRLFDRINHRIYITESGQSLLSYAKCIISDFNAAFLNIKHISQQSILKIGCNISYGCTLLPGIIESFSKKYPDIQVHSTIANSKSIEQKLLNNELDLAIVDNINISPSFKCKLIARENMIMVCGSGYYETMIKNNSHVELSEQKYLMREKRSGTRDSVDELFENINVVPIISMESTSNSALINSAIHNLGIAILPETYVQTYLASGQLLKLDIENAEFLRHYFLIYHQSRYLSTSMQCFIHQFG